MPEEPDILQINKRLEDRGFTGDTPLTDYLVDYYEKYYDTDYDSFSQMALENPAAIVNMQGGMANHQYTVTKDQLKLIKQKYKEEYQNFADKGAIMETEDRYGNIMLQLKWPEKDLAEASYNLFYRDLINVFIGEEFNLSNTHRYLNDAGASYGIFDYMDNIDGLWDETNDYLKKLNTVGHNADEKLTYNFYVGLNGPFTNNAYQDYDFSFGHEITLEQTDGGIEIEKLDSEGNLITDSPAGFNLYYTSLDDDGTVYYMIGYENEEEGGVPVFDTDESKALVVKTVNGKVKVEYLVPREYFIKEVLAPNGYQLNDEVISALVEKGKITEVKVINNVIEPTPGPTPDPTPDPTPEPTPEPVPPTPVPPVPTPIPPMEEIPTIVPVDDAGVLGAVRTEDPIETIAATVPKTIPEKGMVLGATRNSKTGDEADMNVLGMTAGTAMLGLFAWIMANRKKRQWR